MKDYKKILENVVNIINTTEKSDIGFANICTYIGENCPELKESEDERIRKSLLDYLHTLPNHFSHDGSLVIDWIAWLEKQGKQKGYTFKSIPRLIDMIEPSDKAKAYCQKLIDVLAKEGYNTDAKIVEEVLKGWNGEDVPMAIMDEQKPVFEMKTPEESLGIDSDTYNKIVDECIYGDGEQKPTDKLEPKFHEGEWITNGDYTWKIVEVKPLDYILQSQDGNIVDDTISHVDEQFHSFTIEDAKNGDVLSDGTTIFIFKDLLSDGSVMSYCDYDTDSGESDAFCPLSVNLMCSKITPTTKEQRDILFQKMHEAGWEFDFDKKVLKKIEQESTDNDMKEALRTEYEKGRADAIAEMQNLAWNEEDEEFLRRAINATKDAYPITAKWLKSLKDRVQPKQEWNEEDESYLNTTIAYLKDAKEFKKTADNCINWLKSLKPQNRWKPSEKQIEALKNAIHIKPYENPSDSLLWGLYEQLKKLK